MALVARVARVALAARLALVSLGLVAMVGLAGATTTPASPTAALVPRPGVVSGVGVLVGGHAGGWGAQEDRPGPPGPRSGGPPRHHAAGPAVVT